MVSFKNLLRGTCEQFVEQCITLYKSMQLTAVNLILSKGKSQSLGGIDFSNSCSNKLLTS